MPNLNYYEQSSLMNLVNGITIKVKHVVWTIIAWNNEFTMSSELGHCSSKFNLFIVSSDSFLSCSILGLRNTFKNQCLRIVLCCFNSSLGWFSNNHSFSISFSCHCLFMCLGFHHSVCGNCIGLEFGQMFDVICFNHFALLFFLSCDGFNLQVSLKLNLHFE